MTPLKADLSFKKINSLRNHSGKGLLVLGVTQDSKDTSKLSWLPALKKSKEFTSLLAMISTIERFKGDSGEGLALYKQSSILSQFSSYSDLLLFGLGQFKDIGAQDALILGAKLGQELRNTKVTEADVYLDSLISAPSGQAVDYAGRKDPAGKLSAEAFFEKLFVGLQLGLYSFEDYKSSDKKESSKAIELRLLSSSMTEVQVRKILDRIHTLSESVYIARDLMNMPPNDLYPESLAQKAQEIGRKAGFSTTVWDEKKLAAEGMNGILAVGKASVRQPRFIIMQHNATQKRLPTLVLVGKGITFDTGGISLKPGAGMEAMKMDMGGAASVIAAMYGIAKAKAPVRVIALVSAAENMPDGNATRPGDIYKAYGGKTVEILNTDAEGRLVLADALVYAKTFKPDAVIDTATLTGAVCVALGGACVGIMGNNARLLEAFQLAGAKEGERAWELPLYKEYGDDMKSKVADIQNIGTNRNAGSQKGGAFLNFFVDNAYPHLHVDIAGVMDATKEQGPHCTGGGTGIPTRSLIEFAVNFKKYFPSTK
jgi:leucyl aminopeptidase